MKIYHVGERLPDPYYHRAVNRGMGRAVFRRCRAKWCKHEFTNFEIPIDHKWPENRRCDLCPRDRAHKTRILYGRTPDLLEKSDSVRLLTSGPRLALQLGAVYRRRECQQEGCNDPHPRAHTDQLRWSTIEVDATGVVRADVTKCMRCGDRTTVLGRRDVT